MALLLPASYDVPLSVAVFTIIAVVIGCFTWKYLSFSGWKTWALLAALVVASRINLGLLFLPSYGLVMLGCYIAFSSLGTKWLWRSLCAAVPIAAMVFFPLLIQYYQKLDMLMHLKGATNNSGILALFRMCGESFAANSDVHITAALPIVFLSLIPCLYYFGRTNEKRFRLIGLFYLAVFAIQSTAIMLTCRRAAMLSVIIGIVLWIVSSDKYGILKRSRIYAVIGVLLFLAMVIPGNFWSTVYSMDGSASDRQTFATASFSIFQQHPVFGIGFGWWRTGWESWRLAHGATLPIAYFPPHAHCDYTELLAEGGIVGFLLGLCAGLQILMRALRQMFAENSLVMKYLLKGMIIQIISIGLGSAMLSGAMFRFPEWIVPSSALLATILGVCWSQANDQVEDDALTRDSTVDSHSLVETASDCKV